MTYLHQTSRREPLERLPYGGARYTEYLGEAALAGQGLAGLHLAAEHLGDNLLEDVFGYGSAVHRL